MLTVDEVSPRTALAGMRNEWDSFDSINPQPANSSAYGAYYASELLSRPLFLRAFTDGVLVAQWLLYLRRTPGSHFRLTCGAFAGPELSRESELPYETVLTGFVKHIFRKHGPCNLHLLSYALVRGIPESALASSGFQRIEQYGSYVNTLAGDDGLREQFTSNRRYELRRALKAGYEYRVGIAAGDYHKLSSISYRRSGMRGPMRRTLTHIEKHLSGGGVAFLSGVYAEGELNVASIIIHRGRTAYYLYGASADRKAPGATAYIHYENMRHARELGILEYDFGGARDVNEKDRSLAEFKRQFGGRYITCCGGVYR